MCSSPARAGSSRASDLRKPRTRKSNTKQIRRYSCGYACPAPRGATIVAVRTSYYSTTPPAARRGAGAQHAPATETTAAAAPYGLGGYCRNCCNCRNSRGTVWSCGGYCRIGLSAIAYERTIMPSRRTRRRRGHHHPTRHARWRWSIDQPPRASTVTRPTKLRTKLRGGHRPSTRA